MGTPFFGNIHMGICSKGNRLQFLKNTLIKSIQILFVPCIWIWHMGEEDVINCFFENNHLGELDYKNSPRGLVFRRFKNHLFSGPIVHNPPHQKKKLLQTKVLEQRTSETAPFFVFRSFLWPKDGQDQKVSNHMSDLPRFDKTTPPWGIAFKKKTKAANTRVVDLSLNQSQTLETNI